MKPLSKTTKSFIQIWGASLLFFIVLHLLSFKNPSISQATALVDGFFMSLILSVIALLFFLVIYLFIRLIISLFKKES
jgi:hypothetical protein